MSGGVDSSVAALLLKEAGYDVVGVCLHLYSCNSTAAKSCCTAQDRIDARRVCEKLGIGFVSVDHRERFRTRVIEPFVEEYLRGRTPSPCILCNRHLKFDVLFEEASRLGASAIATGHYARIEGAGDDVHRLMRGADSKKDQSYFLFTLSQDQLRRIHFPLGDLTKQEVRRIAKKHGLPTSEKEESQEICFVPDGDYASFVENKKPELVKGPGNFVKTDGTVVGRHRGIHNYTIGQRRGLGSGTGSRQYVVRIDALKNEVVLGTNDDLLRRELIVGDIHWIADKEAIDGRSNLAVQIRSAHSAAKADMELLSENAVRVIFEKPQRAIAPGQAAVFYRGEEVVGGGWIE